MGRFLLTLLEGTGEHEHQTKHLIETTDRQMVKYHFHRTLKDWGYRDTSYGKHCLEGHRGLWAEIQTIDNLDWEEYQVLDEYLRSWPKV